MQSYRNILAFVDSTGDLKAVERAIALAQPDGRVVVTKVVDLSLSDARDCAPDGWEYFREEVLATELTNLDERLASLDHAEIDLRSRVRLGRLRLGPLTARPYLGPWQRWAGGHRGPAHR